MTDHLILLAPSANRVYASGADRLVAAELKIMLGAHDHPAIQPVTVAGVGYLAVASASLDDQISGALGRLSGFYAAFQRVQGRLLPIEVATPDLFDDDLVTIPKYPGKTNEQFTRLLINVTLASIEASDQCADHDLGPDVWSRYHTQHGDDAGLQRSRCGSRAESR
jgi:hypothetical protein